MSKYVYKTDNITELLRVNTSIIIAHLGPDQRQKTFWNLRIIMYENMSPMV